MFRKLSWAAQLAAGVALFVISFLLEGLVLTAFLGNAALAFSLTAALEVSKALTIVLYRFMKNQTVTPYPASTRALVLSFRAALFLLSAVCSVMYLAEGLDRPGLEGARAADFRRLDDEHAAGLARLREEHDSDRREALRGLEERYREQGRAIAERYLPAIRDLEQALDREMGIAVNGRFAGPRYREIERRLAEEKAAYERERARLGAGETREQRRLGDTLAIRYGAAQEKAEEAYHRRRDILSHDDYAGDGRVENPLVDAFITVTNRVLGTGLHTLHFVFTFSLFLSLLIELGIWVAFENLTLAHLPIFMAEQEVAVSLGQKRAATEGDLRGFRMDEALVQGKVSARREDIERRIYEGLATARS
ncbi:MAG: hypothetical protein ACREXX_00905 [Gammaproteobacteria bacterium]